MKSQIENFDFAAQAATKYPFLGASYNSVVLFSAPSKGVVVKSAPHSQDKTGYYSENWDMECFKPLPNNAKVTLQNDL